MLASTYHRPALTNLRSPKRNNSETMNQPGYGRRNEDSNKDKSNDGFIKNRDNRDSSRKDGNAALPMPNLVQIYPPEPPVDPNKPKAKVVVIANLPAGFHQNNIYKLCSASIRNIKPLHVVMKKINRPPAPEVRYAYVYYKTQEEVDVVVEFLNNLPVNDVSLVVKAVDTILQEESNAK